MALIIWNFIYDLPKIQKTYELAHKEVNQAGYFELGKKGAPTFRLLVLGDSIGSGHGVQTFEDAVGSRLALKLAEKYHVVYLNEAGFGKWVSDIANDQIKEHWDMISLIIGSNDVLHGTKRTEFQKACYELADKMKKHTNKIIIAGPCDIAQVPIFPWWYKILIRRRERMVATILNKTAKRAGGIYANVLESSLNPSHLGRDHLHLNFKGHEILFNFIWKKVRQESGQNWGEL
ncbi:MAG TPA: GDSL-type esterase/lipase family protein [Candidatus Saccharimonadales bacterium]|nr:GDSL-type esterase/lipase family protein [Candidatus Saccharimonadales bacterium]